MQNKRLILVAVTVILIAGYFFKVHSGKAQHLPILSFKPGDSYTQEWKRVDSFLQKGLPTEALEKVEAIRKKAIESVNYPQLIKTLVYYESLKHVTSEDAQQKTITEVETETEKAPYPVKPVLQSMLAQMYWNYYENNRYNIQERTVVSGDGGPDISTWDAAKFARKASALYLASLKPTDSLQRTPLNVFDSILILKEFSKKYRPSLYDLLSHRALDFFSNSESGLTESANSFTIIDPAYLGPDEDFVNIKLSTEDTDAFKFKAIKLMQEMSRYQLDRGTDDTKADLDIKRLKYVREDLSLENKDSIYLRALQDLEKRYLSSPISATIGFEIAQELNMQGGKYLEESAPQFRWKKKQALEKCNEVERRFPRSSGSINCFELESRIFNQTLRLDANVVSVPGQPSKIIVDYTNVDSIYFKLVSAEGIREDDLELEQPQLLGRWLSFSPTREWRVALPSAGDHQQHSSEVSVPESKIGAFYLLASGSPKFDYRNEIVSFTRINVSNIGYVERNFKGGKQYFIHDRTSGEPLKSAKVNVFARVYDQLKRKYVRRLRGTYNTDEDGLFLLKTGHRYEDHDVELDISYKGDQLATGEQEYSYNYGDDEHLPKVQEHVFFFLDRGIYRPGQTIYFKGLLMQTINGQNVLMKSTKRKVQLYDVNSKLVTELQLTSNDYGTFNGSFTLPVSGINGTMYIQTPNVTGYKNFRVEEYKRPRFEAKFDPVKGSFRLGDKVTIKGKATTYSGVAVDGAMVQYRIRRSAVFPYANLFSWKISYPDEVDKEIASGKVTTTQNGEFTIDFTANSDPSVSDEKLPQYTYSISVDVTDQNGETQSTQSSVNVGVLALRTNMQLSENYSTTDSQNVKLSTENLNGEFEAAKGSIRIYRLKDPALIKRERLWRAPDQFAISEADYKKKFPLDIYKDEDRYQDWSREQQALDISFDSEKDKTFKLQGLSSWKQGKYLAELETKDHFGKTVKEIKYFTVYDPRNNQMPFTQLSWIHEVATTLEPGGKAQVLIGSSEKNVKVLYEVILKDEVIHKEWITLNNEKKLVELPIEERFRGNVTMNFTFVRDERLFAMPVLVKVPYSNKELKLSFITFRDKLSPGKKEEWKIKISGPAGEKVAAEMLAGMYDASLDAFAPNEWSLDLYPGRAAFDYRLSTWALPNAVSGSVNIHELPNPVKEFLYQAYDALNWFIMPQGDMRYRLNYRRGDVLNTTYCWSNANAVAVGGTQAFGYSANAGTYKLTCHDCNGCCATRATVRFATDFKFEKKDKEQQEVSEFSPAFLKTGEGKDAWGTMPIVKARANFAETAFFLPKLETDTAGNILFNFTVPDALSRWKFLALAHTKDLKSGSITKDAVTQKDLMVNPNAPRFLREGDEIELTAKVNSLIDKELSGNAQLTLTDPFTGKVVTTLFGKDISLRPFNLKKGQSTTVSWKLKVPEGLGVITYKITAAAGNFTDGEEAPLPILTNRMLVTEILPINVKGGQEKSFSLEKLVNSSGSKTMVNHRLTFELSSNPAWYAVQALPYMMEFPHECSEQLFNRFYANSIATHIANSSPRIKQVFESWKGANTPASNLEKNAELKQLLLEETPWVLQGQDETQRKNRVGLLFNLNKMSAEQATALKKLKDNQSINGGWPWFKGMPDNRFITQYVITGLGRMDKLGALNINRDYELQQMTLKGVQYLDNRILEDYRELLKEKIDLKLENVSDIQIQYLYARSFFKEQRVPENIKVAYQYYFDQAQKNWLKQDKYSQAMIAIILHRSGNSKASDEILHSLQETATKNEELGMYWKDNVAGYYWYQAPIETQAMMIEAFSQSGKNEVVVDELRTWLLKQKQVQDWKTTKATSDACYALLLSGSDWLNTTEIPEVTIGGVKIEPGKNAPKADPGTGYFKTSWSTSEIKPEMGKVSVKKQSKGIAWGALYYQYFEQLDKITSAKSPLQLAKKLFLQTNGSKGPVLTPINDHTELKTGDLVKVRIELRSDREMDFVQMKDMRASGFEPVSVLSSYKYQDGLGYYESPKDASTNFFFDHLPKGTFVFEYALRVSQKGDFSNGITTIQSMYAPEFSSHSEGVRVGVK